MNLPRLCLPLIFTCAFLGTAGCSRPDPNKQPESTSASADNTKRNERDRAGETLTPFDQGENESDRAISQQVRQSVVKNDALSMTAKNVKIITVGGVVTLRGPVKSAEEKTTIEGIAKQVHQVSRVDNQLEIASN